MSSNGPCSEQKSWRWVVLSLAFITLFVGIYIRIGFGILLPLMIEELKMSRMEAGLVSTAYFLGYGIFSPVVGTLTDRFGGRKIIPLFCGIMGFGSLMESTVSSYNLALIFYGVVGVGSSAIWTPLLAVTQRWFESKRRGGVVGFVDLGSSAAWAVSGASLPFIVLTLGWRSSWFLMGMMALAIAFIDLKLLRDKPISCKTSKTSPSLKLSHKEVLSSPSFWLIGISYLMLGFAVIVPITFTVTYSHIELDLPLALAASLMTVAGIARIITTPSFGAISDLVGRRAMMLLSHILVSTGLLLFVIVGNDAFLLIVSIFIFGLGNGGAWPLYAASASDHFSVERAGMVIGVWTTLLGIGFILAPVTAGYIADQTGTFVYSFLLSSFLASLGIPLLLFVKKRPAKI